MTGAAGADRPGTGLTKCHTGVYVLRMPPKGQKVENRMTPAETQEAARRAMEHIRSVSYRVSLRWVFYRLLQEGIYGSKGDYHRFAQQASKWRHQELEGWRPDTLEDVTRSTTYRGLSSPLDPSQVVDYLDYYLEIWASESHFTYQDRYLEIWFEARAMAGQFEAYTDGLVLRPFGGHTSIEFKYRMAKDLEEMASRFGKPITILYFGDRDSAGDEILDAAVDGPNGLRKWCGVDFEVIRVGLTLDQAEQYGMPENPDKPGEYQWEALTDDQAHELIDRGLLEHLNQDAFARARAAAEDRIQLYRDELVSYYTEEER